MGQKAHNMYGVQLDAGDVVKFEIDQSRNKLLNPDKIINWQKHDDLKQVKQIHKKVTKSFNEPTSR